RVPPGSADREVNLPHLVAAAGAAPHRGAGGGFGVGGVAHLGPQLRPPPAGRGRNVGAGWPTLPERYDRRFRRMWRYYLAGSMAAARARVIQLWQLVLSPHGVAGGYVAPR